MAGSLREIFGPRNLLNTETNAKTISENSTEDGPHVKEDGSTEDGLL